MTSKVKIVFTTLFLILLSINLFAQETASTIEADSLQSTNPGTAQSGITKDTFWDNLFFDMDIQSTYAKILFATLIFLFAFVLFKYLKQPLQRISVFRTRFSSFLKQIIPFLLTVYWIIILYFITDVLNISKEISLSILIVVGIAIIFASQDIFKDVVAGIILSSGKYLETGTKIHFQDIYGEIVKSGLREIVLIKPDGKLARIPNRSIIKESIKTVYTEQDNCPVTVNFYLLPEADLDLCREIAYKSAIVSPYLYLNKPVTVNFQNLNSNGQTMILMQIEAYLQKIEHQPLFISEITAIIVKEIFHTTLPADIR